MKLIIRRFYRIGVTELYQVEPGNPHDFVVTITNRRYISSVQLNREQAIRWYRVLRRR